MWRFLNRNAWMASDRQERERVRSRIGSLILQFCRLNPTFHMEDLRQFVVGSIGIHHIAPASTDRILRQLRQEGRVRYEVVSRRESLYRVLERPAEQAELFAARAS